MPPSGNSERAGKGRVGEELGIGVGWRCGNMSMPISLSDLCIHALFRSGL